MWTTLEAPAAFLARYDADPCLCGVTPEEMVAMLGPTKYGWELRDEATRRTFEIHSKTPTLLVAGRDAWRIGVTWDRAILSEVVGPFTGARYTVSEVRTAWCGEERRGATWTYATLEKGGERSSRGLSFRPGRTQAEMEAMIPACDRIAAARGEHVDADGAVDLTAEHQPPLTRAGYVEMCRALGVEPRDDVGRDGIASYGMLYGSFSFENPAEVNASVAQELAARRRKGLEVERAAAADAVAAAAPQPSTEQPRAWGAGGVRYDERCARCRRVADVDNDTELCQRCSA